MEAEKKPGQVKAFFGSVIAHCLPTIASSFVTVYPSQLGSIMSITEYGGHYTENIYIINKQVRIHIPLVFGEGKPERRCVIALLYTARMEIPHNIRRPLSPPSPAVPSRESLLLIWRSDCDDVSCLSVGAACAYAATC